MNAKQGARSYVDFDPTVEWSRGEETDILRVYVPGFKKEYIKVQVDNYGSLRTSGERPLEGNQWSRFYKDFRIPENCRVSDIRARLENGTLFITLPKSTTSNKPTVPTQLPPPSKPASAPPKPAPVPEVAKPAPAPQVPKPAVSEPKPTGDQASFAGPRKGRTNGKLGEILSTKQEETVDDMAKGKMAQRIGDKKETKKREEKPVEEKRTGKPSVTEATISGPTKQEEIIDDMAKGRMAQPIGDKKETEKREEKPVEEKRTEKPSVTEATSSGPAKELAQPSQVLTGLQNQQRGLLLNVAVALIVLVGIGFYLSFKLRRIVGHDGEQSNTGEL